MVNDQINHWKPKGVIHMKTLYTKTPTINKLKKAFWKIFSKESTPIKEHLFDLLISVLCLNGFQSVKFNYEHFIENLSESIAVHKINTTQQKI